MQICVHPPALPSRPADGHKGTFGTAALIGGSRGMSGALALAGLAALRGGCGLTKLACPTSIQSVVASFEASYLTIGLPEDAVGRIEIAFADLPDAIRSADAIGIGPGLGQSESLGQLVRDCYAEWDHPLVIDADGLNLLAVAAADGFPRANSPRILTPHPGEMARLTGLSTTAVQADRVAVASDFATRQRCLVVLKGAGTVVTDGDRCYVNSTGNSGMGTGGTGDVLTGLLTSLLAQGSDPYDAACAAVWIHGRAGDLAAERFGARSLIASDLPDYLPDAFRDLAAIAR